MADVGPGEPATGSRRGHGILRAPTRASTRTPARNSAPRSTSFKPRTAVSATTSFLCLALTSGRRCDPRPRPFHARLAAAFPRAIPSPALGWSEIRYDAYCFIVPVAL